MRAIRGATAADAAAIGEVAGAALVLDAAEAPRLVARLSDPPPERRWTALVTDDLDAVLFASVSARDGSAGHIDLLAVRPGAQGEGRGRALVAAAEEWLRAEGVTEARFAGNPPCYAWPGIDVRYTAAACLAESLGYERYNVAWNMTADLSADLSTEADLLRLADKGVTVHAAGPGERAAVLDFVREHWNDNWAWEAAQASGCHYASRDGQILGFAAWGSRPAWFGPMGTAPAARGLGVGRVLLRRCLAEQREAGLASAQISWVGPLGFYSRAVGAHAERVFWLYRRDLR
ncbi:MULTISPECIES: GNAT family N-acetyltransferase [Streptosporangium]|uniref:GNAT superfamily N-acetyltransferase n=1 Tax=Streptosporangium brasiliense TaxID=47480 RepID=A0ABT9RH47_9ACTN|nr:GNAT family N-acetyltransferase [Streptosporangium brasiliense]MDP9867695.1 GNAT superfamily N-acetyltransferase [Streptosporangium brasiliense]